MKEIIISEVITSKTIEKIEYICEVSGCGYKTEYKRLARNHYGAHTPKDKKIINYETFYYFDSKKDAEAWAKWKEVSDYDISIVRWKESGWYGCEDYEEYAGYGYTDCGMIVKPVSYFIEERTRKIKELEQSIKELKKLE